MPLEYRIPDLGLHACDNDLRHLVRFAAMLCVTIIVAPVFIYIQGVSSEDSGPLGCCAMSIFQWPPTFRRTLHLLLGSSSRGRRLFDPEVKGTTVV